jgi:hypothetical protein
MTLISSLMVAALMAQAGPPPAPADGGVLQIESDLVIRGRVRKPQVFFVIPKQVLDSTDGLEAAVDDPIDELLRVAAVDLAPARPVDLRPYRRGSLYGFLRGRSR